LLSREWIGRFERSLAGLLVVAKKEAERPLADKKRLAHPTYS